ncbi:hypothetical protein C1645_840980 [Glomus cerebriforme]|uniref:Uncharacterized protein n=1 Tax=Glomus cerebriforme TaxID=658196 RepID=A0A397RYP8_9GLOM|nr:hypothetical protein C1645_840980 [Glomus cerebriforme]
MAKAYKEAMAGAKVGLKRRREVLLENIITKSSLRNFGKNLVFILNTTSNVGITSSNMPSRRQPSRISRAIFSPNRSHLTTLSISRPPSSGSRPVTPSFSQSAEMINIYINYNEPDDQE